MRLRFEKTITVDGTAHAAGDVVGAEEVPAGCLDSLRRLGHVTELPDADADGEPDDRAEDLGADGEPSEGADGADADGEPSEGDDGANAEGDPAKAPRPTRKRNRRR